MNVFNVGAEWNLSTTSNSTLDMLKRDKERVKGLGSRIGNKSTNTMEAKLVSTPLQSGLSIGTGNYYVKVGVGTPPKYLSLLVDTGSSLSWLQCKPCKGYCHPQVDPLFDSSSSKTYKTLSCSSSLCSSLKTSTLNDPSCEVGSGACVYKASYGDSSFSVGYLSQDVLSLTPRETLQGFVYGCGEDNEGLFGESSGILGLAHHDLSAIAQLSTKYGYAFSYCLPSAFIKPSKGGYLSIGTSSLAKSSYKFTPLVPNPRLSSLYFLDLTAITVAGRPLGVAASSYEVATIIDSGTVITRLPMVVYTALTQAFVNIMSQEYSVVQGVSILDTCFKGSVKEMEEVPEIEILFKGGASLPLNTHNTLLEVEEGVTCLAIAATSEYTTPIAIIGNFQQQTFDVAFDISNSRIGFGVAGCL